MSVYTRVQQHELVAFLHNYQVGALIEYEGIVAGIENTNYFVTTTKQQLVLTLFEGHDHQQVDYYMRLMNHLSDYTLPVARPIALKEGGYLGTLHGKPAALIERLPGRWIESPSKRHCHAIGRQLARIHVSGATFPLRRKDDRGLDWIEGELCSLSTHLNQQQQRLIEDELAAQRETDFKQLPQGVTHADLFRDNALFRHHQVSAIVDFYNACDGTLIYDLAVVANDWCRGEGDVVEQTFLQQLLDGYQSIRRLQKREIQLFDMALRFWVSRLVAQHAPREGVLTMSKDPLEYQRLLEGYRGHLMLAS